MFGNVAEMRVRDDSDLLDVLMVVPDKAQVGHQGAETGPAGKRRGFDDEPLEVTVLLDLRVDSFGEVREIAFLQG